MDTTPRHARTARLLLCSIVAFGAGAEANAAVAVVTNHTGRAVSLEVSSDDGRRETRAIEPGDATPFFSPSPLTATLRTSNGPKSQRLVADAAYRLAPIQVGKRSGVELRRIGLAGEANAAPVAAAWAAGGGAGDAPVRVLLCVDEEEPMRDALWRQRLTERIAKASAILRRYAGVRLEPVGFATWQSDNRFSEFTDSLIEFEREVRPPKGVLAIGFTSQYRVFFGRNRLGGTRGPLRSHILLREWSPRVSESERLELLVHELGHFLGAGHSPEPTSVMRPVLGDRPVRLKDDAIRFDAINTLAIAMIGEEVRGRGVSSLSQVSATRRGRLQRVYTTLAAVTPDEPAGAVLLRRLAGADRFAAAVEAPPTDKQTELATLVVEAVTAAAAANHKRSGGDRLKGEELTDELVRIAAKASLAATPGGDAESLVVGLAIALDGSDGLRRLPRTAARVKAIEPERQRLQRLNVLGDPTASGRRDTLKHFVVSAGMTAMLGAKEANLWGAAKELSDANGGSGFSFADLAADRAGVRFAERLLAGNPPVTSVARSFRIANYAPSLQDLEEGLSLKELLDKYGGQGDPRYDAQIAEIDRRVDALPAYSLGPLEMPTLR